MKAHILSVLTVFVLWIHQGTSLHCYQCDSTVDPDCKEDFDWPNLKTLTIKPTKCTVDQAQFCIKTTGVWGGLVGTQRFCSSRDMFNQCQYIDFSDHNRRYRGCIYTCKGDACNHAPRSVTSSTFVVVATLLSLLFVLYRT